MAKDVLQFGGGDGREEYTSRICSRLTEVTGILALIFKC